MHFLSRVFACRIGEYRPIAGPIIVIGRSRFERLHGHGISFLADANRFSRNL
jgi:hypothetical protein